MKENEECKSAKCIHFSQRRGQRKRKRNTISSSSDEDINMSVTDKEQNVRASKMSTSEPKQSVKKHIDNDHIRTIVKLKEKEIEKQDKTLVSKLTRSKARALNQRPIEIAPARLNCSDSDVVVLIHEDLHSDDEDEEYQPCEDDLLSDDEQNTTTSDIDSQPTTPQTPYNPQTDNDTPKYTNDGLFKIPRDRNDSCSSQTEADYKIAARTRSKVCLTTTPIETIESTFIPPDITTDMYDFDTDIDNVWCEFLREFTKPMSNNNDDDDDQTDPEYVADPKYVEDRIPVDKEELREVNIPRKELIDLLSELCDSINVEDLEEIDEYYRNIPIHDLSARTVTEQKETVRQESLVANNINKTAMELTSSDLDNSEYYSSQKNNPDIETTVSITPFGVDLSRNINTTVVDSQSFTNLTTMCPPPKSNILPPSVAPVVNVATASPTTQTINIQAPIVNSSLVVPFSSINPYNGATIDENGSIQMIEYQNILIQVPTIEILKQQHENLCGRITQKHDGYRLPKNKNSIDFEFPSEQENILINDSELNYGSVITSQQHTLLCQQLRMHVQLATQSFLQTYGHPEKWTHAKNFKKFVIDINDTIQPNSQLVVTNLRNAIQLMNDWEDELSVESEENTNYINHIHQEINHAKLYQNYSKVYIMKFNKRLLDRMVRSSIFIYPQLLPKIPFKINTKKDCVSVFIPSEEYLISYGLQYFYDCLKERNPSAKKNVSLREHYFKYKRHPPFKNCIQNIDLTIPPIGRVLGDLPYIWAKHVERIKSIEFDKLITSSGLISSSTIQASNTPKTQVVAPYKSDKLGSLVDNVESINTFLNPSKENENRVIYKVAGPTIPEIQSRLINRPVDEAEPAILEYRIDYIDNSPQSSSSVDVGILRTTEEIEPIAQSTILDGTAFEHDDCLVKCHSPISICSYNPSEKSSDYFHLPDCNCKTLSSRSSSSRRTLRKYVEKGQKLLTQYFTPISKKSNFQSDLLNIKKLNRETNSRIISQILTDYKEVDIVFLNQFSNQNSILKVYKWLRMIDIYTNLLREYCAKMNSLKRLPNTKSSEDLIKRQKEETASPSTVVDVAINGTNIHPIDKEPTPKRGLKSVKASDNNRLLLLPDSREETNEKDMVFAQNFLDKVEETYLEDGNKEKFNEFEDILRNFDVINEKATDLYHKLENLFLPDHPELAEIFLTFLLPGEAAQIGKFFEHFISTNMSNFINKLNIYFSKQPAQIRKILACLQELSLCENIHIEQVKTKILPLLKGNSLLTEWFLQCFSVEGFEELSYVNKYQKYEIVNVRPSVEPTEDIDVYENMPQKELLSDPVDNPCHVKYMNGRIYYGNRILLPAQLSFVLNEANQTSNSGKNNTNSDVSETAESQNQEYFCVHNIKTYGDQKLREQNRNSAEAELNYNTSAEILDISNNMLNDDSKTSDEITPICDGKILKAHAVRLNPNANVSVFVSHSEMLELLKTSGKRCESKDVKLCQSSPKKQLSTISHTKYSKKSPTKKNKSPTSGGSNKKSITTLSVTESCAISTSKKLKMLIESDSDPIEKAKRQKKCNITKKVIHKELQQNKKNVKLKIEIRDHLINEDEDNDSSAEEATILPQVAWTRDEDKILLEHVKGGFNSDTDLVDMLIDKLPDRSRDDIFQRYQFLMDFLAKLHQSDA